MGALKALGLVILLLLLVGSFVAAGALFAVHATFLSTAFWETQLAQDGFLGSFATGLAGQMWENGENTQLVSKEAFVRHVSPVFRDLIRTAATDGLAYANGERDDFNVRMDASAIARATVAAAEEDGVDVSRIEGLEEALAQGAQESEVLDGPPEVLVQARGMAGALRGAFYAAIAVIVIVCALVVLAFRKNLLGASKWLGAGFLVAGALSLAVALFVIPSLVTGLLSAQPLLSGTGLDAGLSELVGAFSGQYAAWGAGGLVLGLLLLAAFFALRNRGEKAGEKAVAVLPKKAAAKAKN